MKIIDIPKRKSDCKGLVYHISDSVCRFAAQKAENITITMLNRLLFTINSFKENGIGDHDTLDELKKDIESNLRNINEDKVFMNIAENFNKYGFRDEEDE